ncbi:MAG: NmrA family NAD(P)-binding protein [Gemmatimonadaceae bacterium]
MPDKKIIAIAGATGHQGGGLARAILNDKNSEFAVRALTRDPNAGKARALRELGAEVVQADLHDESSVRRAFEGAYGAYCVTFFWAHMSPEKEFAEEMAMNDKNLAGIASEDIGKCAYGIFRRGPELAGKRIGLAGDQLTGEEMAEKFSKAFGRPVQYNPVPFDVLRGMGFPAAKEYGNMFQFYVEFEDVVAGTRDVEQSRKLNPELQNFDEWLSRNRAKFSV